MSKNLTIIILTFNSQDIIKECLSRVNFDKYKVVVVDNNSKDDTLKIVQENFHVDKLYQLPRNIGFGNANNVALQEVDSDYALVLNPDAMIEDADIEIVLKAMESDEKAAIAGPVILEKYPYDAGEYDERLQYMQRNHGFYYEDHNLYYANFLVGCTLFFKMSVMKKLGFFDKNIFLFYEENELCHRVRQAGYHPIVVKGAKALHLKEASSTKSLTLLYLRNWHFVWSRIYWKSFEKGLAKARISCVRNMLIGSVFFISSIFTCDQEKRVKYQSLISASFAFLIGLKPFKKDGTPRLN